MVDPAPVTVEFTAGQNVFDVLLATVKANAIHMEYQNTPMYETAYIEGIGNLYEFDCGELSGWMYRVNGWFPNYGCSRYAGAGRRRDRVDVHLRSGERRRRRRREPGIRGVNEDRKRT